MLWNAGIREWNAFSECANEGAVLVARFVIIIPYREPETRRRPRTQERDEKRKYTRNAIYVLCIVHEYNIYIVYYCIHVPYTVGITER